MAQAVARVVLVQTVSLAAIAGKLRVKLPAFGVVGPATVKVPTPPLPLKTTPPVRLLLVPRTSELAPATVRVLLDTTDVLPFSVALPVLVANVPLLALWSKLLAPPVKVMLLAVLIVVSPLIVTAPVPVLKVPLLVLWSKLPAAP